MEQHSDTDSTMITCQQLIDTIIKNTGAPTVPNTVDSIKEGNPETPVKGIITCMCATKAILEQAVEKKCNLIVVHEPLYYNHFDKTEALKADPVYREKRQFIKEHNLVIWRFHDYIHRIQPDAIVTGMVRKLGWEKFGVEGEPFRFAFPEMSLTRLLDQLKENFPDNAFQVIGDPKMTLSNVEFIPGAPGGSWHVRVLQNKQVDVLVAGEAAQWETYEYVRDAVDQGRRKAAIFIGHVDSEDEGMNFCAHWMKKCIPTIPIHYIRSGSPYWTY